MNLCLAYQIIIYNSQRGQIHGYLNWKHGQKSQIFLQKWFHPSIHQFKAHMNVVEFVNYGLASTVYCQLCELHFQLSQLFHLFIIMHFQFEHFSHYKHDFSPVNELDMPSYSTSLLLNKFSLFLQQVATHHTVQAPVN